jgi:adenylate cyclase
MTEERVERRLAAILAADIAGYSRLMGVDEEGTLSQLKAHRKDLIDRKITEHRGRIVKTTGDGMLVEFFSVVDAVRCAVDIQRAMVERNRDVPAESRIQFRIGINVGDIIIDDNDIFGDGVNVAARLEALADPGGIMVSSIVHDHVRDKLSFGFEDLGTQSIKNIARPVGVHRVRITEAAGLAAIGIAAPGSTEATNSNCPSIAVLPFQNMSGDPEQEYFADGIVEDIITALSRNHALFVIARNSTFTYKGRATDVKQVGRDLGVRYVLEGSVRRSADRVRVTGQLIDTSTGAHLWADRFDGLLKDIFDLQDDITLRVVGAIAPKLEYAEIVRALRKPTESLDAYDYYMRGMSHFHKAGREDIGEALQLFLKATELDENFSTAYGMAAWCLVRRRMNGWAEKGQEQSELARVEEVCERAVDCGRDDAIALACSGLAIGYGLQNFDRAISLFDRAQALNPNLAMAWHLSSWIRSFVGQQDVAVMHLDQAARLSPVDPQRPGMQASIACAHFAARRFDVASASATTAMLEEPNNFMATIVAAAANAMIGNLDIARSALGRARLLDPNLHLQKIKDRLPYKQPELLALWEDALRKAGLPE